jgi:hypothetical protein
MTTVRFSTALALGVAAVALTSPAAAQTAAAARIADIRFSQAAAEAGGGVSILVVLTAQPKAATVTEVGGGLVVDIDGVALPALAFDPAGEGMVRHVAVTPPGAEAATGASRIRFDGAAFTAATTTIYRDAVLVEARLAEAKLADGASLMAGAKAAAATPAKAAVRPAVAPAAEPAAGQAVGSAVKPAAAAAAAVAAADDKTHMIHAPAAPAAAGSAATPATAKPAAVEVAAAARPAAPTAPTAPSLPVVAPVAVDKPAARPASVTALAKLDANACAQAETQLKDDAWALGALGNRALCLIDQQKYPEAKNRIDQLAAFSPEDWRVELGRGALAAQKGDASQAEISYRNAAQLAPDEATRTAIKQMLAKLAGPAVN